MHYIKISESMIFCGICDEYALDTIVVDDELLEYIIGLPGIIAYKGEFTDKLLTIADKDIFTNIEPLVEYPTEIEILQRENITLKDQVIIQDELINVTMMATDEVFTLLEPLLTSNPEPQLINSTFRTVKEVSPMVDMYVAMVMRGLKTIDQVPLRYRPDVKAMLEALEE